VLFSMLAKRVVSHQINAEHVRHRFVHVTGLSTMSAKSAGMSNCPSVSDTACS
jgi:hypothetical protein